METASVEEIEELIESEEEEEVKPKRKQTKEEETLSKIAQELYERGITKAVAIDFAESFSEEYLLEKIALHDYKKETSEITQNAAGWLREAIVRDFKLSEQQLKKQAKLSKKKAQQDEQRTLEEKAKEIQEQRLKEALKDFPSEEQWIKERIMERIKMREMTIKAVGGERFTEEEVKAMYLNFSLKVPKTDEEKRGWLISNYSEYALSTIISELRPKLREAKEQQQSRKEESTSTANEQVLFNSVEEVLAEVARQQAEFSASQKRSENSN